MSLDLIRETQQVLGDGDTKIADLLPKMVCMIIEREEWKKQKNKEGEFFETFPQFVEYRLWWGLGISYAKLMRYCEDHEKATRLLKEQIGESRPVGKPKGGDLNVDNINIREVGGTSPTYALRRLKRDRPDLADKVIAGEMSAYAAAVEAGFRTKTVSVPVDPERAARVLIKNFSREEREAIAAQITAEECLTR